MQTVRNVLTSMLEAWEAEDPDNPTAMSDVDDFLDFWVAVVHQTIEEGNE